MFFLLRFYVSVDVLCLFIVCFVGLICVDCVGCDCMLLVGCLVNGVCLYVLL